MLRTPLAASGLMSGRGPFFRRTAQQVGVLSGRLVAFALGTGLLYEGSKQIEGKDTGDSQIY